MAHARSLGIGIATIECTCMCRIAKNQHSSRRIRVCLHHIVATTWRHLNPHLAVSWCNIVQSFKVWINVAGRLSTTGLSGMIHQDYKYPAFMTTWDGGGRMRLMNILHPLAEEVLWWRDDAKMSTVLRSTAAYLITRGRTWHTTRPHNRQASTRVKFSSQDRSHKGISIVTWS